MNYKELFQEENESVRERFDLSLERIGRISWEETTEEPFCSYFRLVADFIGTVARYYEIGESEEWFGLSLEALKEWNHLLYGDLLPEHYETSYGNPAYARTQLGEEMGGLLSYLYGEIRNQIVFAREGRLTEMTILNEMFIEIYNLFEAKEATAEAIKEIIHYFIFDYCDRIDGYRVREQLDPTLFFAKRIVTDSDLRDLRYLYQYGEYISESEMEVAGFLNSLPDQTISRMADTITQGYRKGFEVMRKDLSAKKTVLIRFEVGFERLIRKVIEGYEAMGLKPIICRSAVFSLNRNAGRKVGYFSSSANKQYDYDHRYDCAVYMNKAIKDRRLAVLKVAYEAYRKEAGWYAGPSLIQTFGETGFSPVNKKEAWALSEKQEQLVLQMTGEMSLLANQYIPGNETSFSIIAFPVPSIGPDFNRIFEETIRINTLDYERYQQIQKSLIDTLDQADWVEIKGKGGNRTDLKVSLHRLADREKETNFENCLADVNIPLGEVFTSPVLEGTQGILHVSQVYINEISFQNLFMEFKDGMIGNYGCDNFDNPEDGKALIRQMILKNHQTLPLGEFAIGTNTVAYAMAREFGIVDRLPILIVEKMGPHFAVGDTCYSWAEDNPTYNFDGKQVVATDNEVSILRKEDTMKAYFNCHTDITIPYDELESITAVTGEGERFPVIRDGKFAVSGTEELNKPLT